MPEGKFEFVQFKAAQIAFSIIGKVWKLNKDPVEGILIEVESQSEATTDHTGSFRIRGLAPNRQYSIYPKSEKLLYWSPQNVSFIMN